MITIGLVRRLVMPCVLLAGLGGCCEGGDCVQALLNPTRRVAMTESQCSNAVVGTWDWQTHECLLPAGVADCIADGQHVYDFRSRQCRLLTPEYRAELQRQYQADQARWNEQVEYGYWEQCFEALGGDYRDACHDRALQRRVEAVKLFTGSTNPMIPTEQRIGQCAQMLSGLFTTDYATASADCRMAAGR
jgi:hypothetical protein